jgi:hypothetical protein
MHFRPLVLLVVLFAPLALAADDAADTKKALQAVGDFVGEWKGNAEAKGGKPTLWKENYSWAWKFKDGDAPARPHPRRRQALQVRRTDLSPG